MKPFIQVNLTIIAMGALACCVGAASPPTDTAATQPATRPSPQTARPLTVAVLDFAASTPAMPDLGQQIAEMLTVLLSAEVDFRLVERAVLARTLQEHELNLTGLVETSQAIEVGRLVGARVLVVGRAFPMGRELFLTAKLIGTETSLVEGVLVKGKRDADLGALVLELADKVATTLRTAGPRLVALPDIADPLPALRSRLADRAKPTVAVIIPERHLNQWRPLPDPAVETEIKQVLQRCGLVVQDVPGNELAEFARSFSPQSAPAWPQALSGVDIVIIGEGFSEFAARIGNLVSCGARAEVNVIHRGTGEIWLSARTTQRGVDLSENIAGKKALQRAGYVLGLQTLETLAERLPAAESPRP